MVMHQRIDLTGLSLREAPMHGKKYRALSDLVCDLHASGELTAT